MDNYQKSRDRAERWFLGFDQQKCIQYWHLQSDENWLYTAFLGTAYRICRNTGKVFRMETGEHAGFEETLAIFDLLCHEGENKCICGEFAPVNSLNGCAKGVGVETGFHSQAALHFDSAPDAFCKACLCLGGVPIQMGDIGFRFQIFGDLSVILKFYRADEDFPASMTLLWDANMLSFVFYETVFYIAGYLIGRIEAMM